MYKNKLLPGDVACIGGPVEALERLEGVHWGHTLGYLTQLTIALKNSKPRLEFFPDSKHIDKMFREFMRFFMLMVKCTRMGTSFQKIK